MQHRVMRLSRWRLVLFLAALILAILLLGSAKQPAIPQSPTAPQAASEWRQRLPIGKVEKRVLALYYPWYRTLAFSGKWAHQDAVEPANRRMASHTHYPV